MDKDILKRLYDFNIAYEDEEGPINRKRRVEEDGVWGGSSVRTMVQLIYILAFLCLLRFDEVLNIQWSWITTDTHNGRHRIKLALPYRKTHQYGGESFRVHKPFSTSNRTNATDISPFFLYENTTFPWLCPVKAFAHWIQLNEKNNSGMNGYVFRRKVNLKYHSDGRFGMVSACCLLLCSFAELDTTVVCRFLHGVLPE